MINVNDGLSLAAMLSLFMCAVCAAEFRYHFFVYCTFCVVRSKLFGRRPSESDASLICVFCFSFVVHFYHRYLAALLLYVRTHRERERDATTCVSIST